MRKSTSTTYVIILVHFNSLALTIMIWYDVLLTATYLAFCLNAFVARILHYNVNVVINYDLD